LSVLELGCGPGFLSEALLQKIARYTLVDFSAQMLDLSRSRLAKFKDRRVLFSWISKRTIGLRRFPAVSI